MFVAVSNLFFLSFIQSYLLLFLFTGLVVGGLLLMNFKWNKFLRITSICWIGAQFMLTSVVFLLFDINEVLVYFSELRQGHFCKVG